MFKISKYKKFVLAPSAASRLFMLRQLKVGEWYS